MAFSASQRIEARCTRCKDLTSHIVIVVVDNVPAKVECCACGSIHKYYPPAGEKKPKNTSPLRVSANQTRATAVENRAKSEKQTRAPRATSALSPSSKALKAMKESADLEQLWLDRINNTVAQAKEYSPSLEVAINDIVEHSVFGAGIVDDIVGSDKASILFKEGYKVLKCVVN